MLKIQSVFLPNATVKTLREWLSLPGVGRPGPLPDEYPDDQFMVIREQADPDEDEDLESDIHIVSGVQSFSLDPENVSVWAPLPNWALLDKPPTPKFCDCVYMEVNNKAAADPLCPYCSGKGFIYDE